METGNLNEKLQHKIGPLPVWAWGVVIGGGFLAFRVISGRGFGGDDAGTADGLTTAVGAGTRLPIDGAGSGTNPVPKQPGPCGRMPNWKPSKDGHWQCNKDLHKWIWNKPPEHKPKPKPKPKPKCNQAHKPNCRAGYRAECHNGKWRCVNNMNSPRRYLSHDSDMLKLASNTLNSHQGEAKHSPPSVSGVRVRNVTLPAPRGSAPVTPRKVTGLPRRMTTATRTPLHRYQDPSKPVARRYGSPRPTGG